jgi:hypothetical protein
VTYDTYHANLPCQWIDSTGLPDGTYQVEVMVNPEGGILETTIGNNAAPAAVEICGDGVTLVGPWRRRPTMLRPCAGGWSRC